MPDKFRPSEFGGKAQRNTIQPPIRPDGKKGHTPTSSEKLRLTYLTGQDVDSTMPPDNGESMTGLLRKKDAEAVMPRPTLQRDLEQ